MIAKDFAGPPSEEKLKELKNTWFLFVFFFWPFQMYCFYETGYSDILFGMVIQLTGFVEMIDISSSSNPAGGTKDLRIGLGLGVLVRTEYHSIPKSKTFCNTRTPWKLLSSDEGWGSVC